MLKKNRLQSVTKDGGWLERRLGGSLNLVEEGFHLIKASSVESWVTYLLGTLPFLLALIYFWGDLVYRPKIETSEILGMAGTLSLLYIWMKVWHSVYTMRLLEDYTDEKHAKLTAEEWRRIIFSQGIVQPTSWIILPTAILLLFPFGWCYAFYHNFNIIGGKVRAISNKQTESLWTDLKRSWAMAMARHKENHLLIWMVSPYLMVLSAVLVLATIYALQLIYIEELRLLAALMMVWIWILAGVLILMVPVAAAVAINIASVIIVGPMLVKILFGIESSFTMSGTNFFSTTFVVIVCALTFLVMEPLVKAAYVLRIYRESSKKTGRDLLVNLHKVKKKKSAIQGQV
ncbi:MAG: hypothetical protein AAGA18_06735 [Verrucomicrobiota bacterium]